MTSYVENETDIEFEFDIKQLLIQLWSKCLIWKNVLMKHR